MLKILIAMLVVATSATAVQAADAPISLKTRFTKRAIINQAKTIHEFRKRAPAFVNQQRYLPSTGYNGRFLLQKSRLQSGTVGNVRQANIRNARGGVYKNVLPEFTSMSRGTITDTRRYTIRLNPRSVRAK